MILTSTGKSTIFIVNDSVCERIYWGWNWRWRSILVDTVLFGSNIYQNHGLSWLVSTECPLKAKQFVNRFRWIVMKIRLVFLFECFCFFFVFFLQCICKMCSNEIIELKHQKNIIEAYLHLKFIYTWNKMASRLKFR